MFSLEISSKAFAWYTIAMNDSTILMIGVLFFSVIIHELAHGYAALSMGDPTAKLAGRLTLNPLAHIDVFGSIIVPILTALGGVPFGWAKPVPYNPYNLRDQRYGALKVAIAGPLSNLGLAAVFAGILAYSSMHAGPFAGASQLFVNIIYINVALAIFNLAPIPPLDGFTVLAGILPQKYVGILHSLERYSFVILLLFVYFGYAIIQPIINVVFNALAG